MACIIRDEDTQLRKVTWWAEGRNATVIETTEYGFVYMLPNGDTYSISWSEACL